VEQFRYLGATLTNQNSIHEEIKNRSKSGNACYHSLQNTLSSSFLSTNINTKIYRSLILPLVLYGLQAWSLTLREEHRLRLFDNMVLKTIFRLKRDEVTGEWRRIHKGKVYNLYTSPNIIRVIKSRRTRWPGHVERLWEMRAAYMVLVGRPEGRNHLEDLRDG